MRAQKDAFETNSSRFDITPASFSSTVVIHPHSYAAGAEGNVNVSFVTRNSWPVDGKLVVQFPIEYTSIIDASVVGQNSASLGTFTASVSGLTATLSRQGDGSVTAAGTQVQLTLSKVKNPEEEGLTAVYPIFKTTTADVNVAIDEISSDFNSGDRAQGNLIEPATFSSAVVIHPHSYVAGAEGNVNMSFVTKNPWPADGKLVVQFPVQYTSIMDASIVGQNSANLGTFTFCV